MQDQQEKGGHKVFAGDPKREKERGRKRNLGSLVGGTNKDQDVVRHESQKRKTVIKNTEDR